MSFTWYDPISERWITPPEKPEPTYDWAEIIAANNEMAEHARAEERRRALAEKIWAITRQVAQGVNAPTTQAETA